MDPRAKLLQSSGYGALPKPAGKLCPDCLERAKAVHSNENTTYFQFRCGVPPYKQSRSLAAIIQLRRQRQAGELVANQGCKPVEF